MLCERCKIREANIRYTEVINGVKNEHNLCVQCAQDTELGHYATIFEGEFPLSKLLAGILGMESEDTSKSQVAMNQIICPTCKTSYNEFIKNSQLGCPDCYSVFDLLIGESIKKLQGNESHVGKKPKYQAEGRTSNSPGLHVPHNLSYDEELTLLDSKLKEAIREEEYELAAKYRDEIKALKEAPSRVYLDGHSANNNERNEIDG